MKITRIELCHPVNRPGKHDDNIRSFTASDDGWALDLWQLPGGAQVVIATNESEPSKLYIPMSNIRSIT